MIRFKFLIFAALGLQIMAVLSQDEILTRAVILSTYPLLIIVAIINRRLWGMRLILAGALLNFIVMAANGGLMPISSTAVVKVGGQEMIDAIPIGEPLPGSKSVLVQEHQMVLGAFADRFVVDFPIIGLKVLSVGDLLIGAGMILATAQILNGAATSVLGENRHG